MCRTIKQKVRLKGEKDNVALRLALQCPFPSENLVGRRCRRPT